MKTIVIVSMLSIILNAQSYEDKFYKDQYAHPSRIGIHSTLGYSSYLVESHSSELDGAISYDILDFTLGASYSYDKWMWGLSGKFVLDELQSNMNVIQTGDKRNDHAHINRDEFAIYTNYTLKESQKSRWSANAIYRYAKLDAIDSYLSYNHYKSLFKYKTQGVALSFVYTKTVTDRSSWFINTGGVYSRAKVEISEKIEGQLQDSYVDDHTTFMGFKFSSGYNHKILPNLFFNLRVDGWQSSFGKLKVTSRVGDTLPKATLKEQLFTLSTGLTWHFE